MHGPMDRPRRAVAVGALLVVSLGVTSCGSQPAPRAQPAAPAASTSAATPTSPTSDSASDPAPDGTPSRKPKAAASPAASEAPAAPAVPEVLQFASQTVDGQAFDGATLAGKPTLLWFWAPWCPVCRGQIPQVQGIAGEYDGEVNVVGVGSLDDAAAIGEFAGDADGVTHLLDENGEVWARFGIVEQSSFVLLDAEGNEVLRAGYGGTDDLEASVAALAD